MEAGEESRKLLCQCGKPLGIFTAQGLELYLPVLLGEHNGAVLDPEFPGRHRVRGGPQTPGPPTGWRTTITRAYGRLDIDPAGP